MARLRRWGPAASHPRLLRCRFCSWCAPLAGSRRGSSAEAFAREVLAAHGTSQGAPLGIGVALAHGVDEADRAVACARAAAQRAHERQPVVVAQTESASRKRGAASGTGDAGGAPAGNEDEPVQSSAASQQLFASARRADFDQVRAYVRELATKSPRPPAPGVLGAAHLRGRHIVRIIHGARDLPSRLLEIDGEREDDPT